MLSTRFAALAAFLLLPSLTLAQSGFGSLGLGGGVLIPESDPGIFAGDGTSPLPAAGAHIRVIESPVLLGFYLDVQLVSLSSVREEVLLSEDLGETGFAMNVGATVPLPLTGTSALYLLGGGRLSDSDYSGGELGGGLWLGFADQFALHAEGGYLFVSEDGFGATPPDGAYFVRGGLGIQIEG